MTARTARCWIVPEPTGASTANPTFDWMASGAGSTAISRGRCGPLPSRIEEPKLPVAKQITVRLSLGPPLNLTAFARLVLGHAAGVWHSRKKFNRQLEGAACA